MDWFLYDKDLRHKRVKRKFAVLIQGSLFSSVIKFSFFFPLPFPWLSSQRGTHTSWRCFPCCNENMWPSCWKFQKSDYSFTALLNSEIFQLIFLMKIIEDLLISFSKNMEFFRIISKCRGCGIKERKELKIL